jgi:transcriptional regulator GlxA family with amidase domain
MRFFRTATGLTFSAYSGQLRVSRAYQLLLESDLSLTQIAAETGFCDQCHLSRHIRHRFGTSPGRIRSQQRALGTK